LHHLQIMYQVFSGQKPPCNRTDMPEPYGQLIDDCWQEDPEERPTFAAILQRLRGMYKDERQRLHNLQVRSPMPRTVLCFLPMDP
jgi:hypothetical protein